MNPRKNAQELSSRVRGHEVHDDSHRALLHDRPHHPRPPDGVHLQAGLFVEASGDWWVLVAT